MKKAFTHILFSMLIIFCLAGCVNSEPAKNVEEKTISVTCVAREKSEEITITTQGENLAEALLDEGIAIGERGTYGLYIHTVNGIRADEEKEEWWCITKAGEAMMTGAEGIKISDGDKYELTLKEGY